MDSFPQPNPGATPTAPEPASEPVTPASSGPFSSLPRPADLASLGLPSLGGNLSGGLGGGSGGVSRGGGGGPIMLVLVVLFGLGTLVFALMAFVSYTQAQSAQRNLNAKIK